MNFVPIDAKSLLSYEQYIESSLSYYDLDAYSTLKFKNMTLEQQAENRYFCKECSRSFPKLLALKSHEKMHNEEKRHTCIYCQKPFSRRHDMHRHERIVHCTQKNLTCSTSVAEIDPTFRQYGSHILDNHITDHKMFNGQIHAQSFQPNANQVGYQLRQSKPINTPFLKSQDIDSISRNDLLHKQEMHSLALLEPYQQSEDLQQSRIFQFEKQSLSDDNFRLEFIDDRFYALNDGLIIAEQERNEYPSLDPVLNAFEVDFLTS